MPSWKERALAAEKLVQELKRELRALEAERELDKVERPLEPQASFWECGHLRFPDENRCSRCR